MLMKNAVLAAKVEGTVGTAESLSASDAAWNAYNFSIAPTTDMSQRMGQGSGCPLPAIPGPFTGRCEFDVDCARLITGADPPWATLLPSCRWVGSSHVFKPVTSGPGANGVTTHTLGKYNGGILEILYGAMGNFSFRKEAGRPVYVHFEFMGIYKAVTDVAIITPDYPMTKPPRFVSGNVTLAGANLPLIRELTLNSGNELTMIEDANATDGLGYCLANPGIVNGSFDPEARVVATRDDWGIWRAGTEAALTWAIDGVAFSVPKCQRTNVQPLDRGGLRTNQIDWQCNRSADLGDDCLAITLS